MKVIIAGGRTILDPQAVLDAIIASKFGITEVVSGGAAGVDSLGEQWAKANGRATKVFPADWAQHGRAAGPRRNIEMADYGEALIAVWDGESRGTAHMIAAAKAKGIPVYVHRVTVNEEGMLAGKPVKPRVTPKGISRRLAP